MRENWLTKLSIRLVAAVLLIVVSEMAIRAMGYSFIGQPANQPKTSIREMPMKIGTWTGLDRDLDPDLFRNTGASELISRHYDDAAGGTVDLSAGTWLSYDVAIPHKAEICYTMAGWEIANREIVQVPVDGRPPFAAKVLTFDQHDERVLVMYWVKFADLTALEDDDIRRGLQNAVRTGKARPAAVKVMLQTNGKNVENAKRDLIDFAGQIAPFLQRFDEE